MEEEKVPAEIISEMQSSKTAQSEESTTEIAIIDERTIRDKIYEVRGVKVMLDFELAEIYGYTTKAFNQQVKRNSAKFEDDFMFQLTREEIEELSRSQNVTSIQTQGVKGGLDKLSDVVTKSEISPILLEMGKPEEKREYLLINGQPAKADETYIDIYSKAKHSIIIIDDYVNIKTLRHLQMVKPGTSVVLYSDNFYNMLHASDYADFQTEFPGVAITFQRTMNKFHDRFIVLDFNTKDERMFHCGASSKDAGNKTTSITEYTDNSVKKAFHNIIAGMQKNPLLKLK